MIFSFILPVHSHIYTEFIQAASKTLGAAWKNNTVGWNIFFFFFILFILHEWLAARNAYKKGWKSAGCWRVFGGADPVTSVQQVSAEVSAGQELAAQKPYEAGQGGPAWPGGNWLLHRPLQQSTHASVRRTRNTPTQITVLEISPLWHHKRSFFEIISQASVPPCDSLFRGRKQRAKHAISWMSVSRLFITGTSVKWTFY